MSPRTWLSVLVLTLASVGPAAAGAPTFVPQGLPHQGRLLKNDDSPVTAVIDVTFSLYKTPTGSASVWTQTKTVAIDSGYYSVLLGDTTADPPEPAIDPALFSDQLYLGVKIPDSSEFSPRLRIATVPWAYRADLASRLIGGTIEGATITGSSIDATEIRVGGVAVVDQTGHFVGPTDQLDASRFGGKAPGAYATWDASDLKYVQKAGDSMSGDLTTTGKIKADGALVGATFESKTTTGAPLIVASTTLIPNLNAEMVGGKVAADLVGQPEFASHNFNNALANSSFERWKDATTPTYWQAFGAGASGTRRQVVGNVGEKALAIADNDLAETIGERILVAGQAEATMLAGLPLTATVYAKRLGGSATGQLCISDTGDAEAESSMTCVDLAGSDQWTRAVVHHTVSSSPSYIAVILKPTKVKGEGGDYAFDNAMLTVGPQVVPWTAHPTEQIYENGIPAAKLVQGSGSGLDADTLDTLDSAQFMRSDADTQTTGALTVGGATRLKGAVQVDGATVQKGTLQTDGAASFGSTVLVTGAATYRNTVQVDGAATFGSTLQATGAATFKGTLQSDGAATFGSTTLTNGAATFKGPLQSDGAATFATTVTANGAAALKNTLTVDGATTLGSTLQVNGATALKNTLTVDGAGTFSTTLQANGAAALKSTLTVDGGTTLKSIATVTGLLTTSGGIKNDNGYYYTQVGEAVRGNDSWLRLNQAGSFTSGVHTPGNFYAGGNIRADGGINSQNAVYYVAGVEAITGNDWFRLNNQSQFNNRIYTPSHFRADAGINSQNGVFYASGVEAITGNDWFRLNNGGNFNNRIYTPSLMRADGNFTSLKTTGQCDCYAETAIVGCLDGNDRWCTCAGGYFMQGMYRGGCDNLHCIEYYHCCRPCN